MSRYHFHVHDDRKMRDIEGTELPDLKSAQIEGVRLAGALLAREAAEFWNVCEWSMDVTDDKGLVLFTLDFSATLAPALRQIPEGL